MDLTNRSFNPLITPDIETLSMPSALQPKGLENWIDILNDHLLPVLPASAKRISLLLKSPTASLHDMAEVIANDPVMRVHLIRECNRQFGNRVEGILSNPYHCVSLMGLDKLSILLRQFKACSNKPADSHNYHYFQAITNSLHAAHQTVNLARLRRQALNPDQLFLSTLLYGAPTWCLWRFAYQEMRIIDHLYYQKHVPLQEAEYAVLGCSKEQITQALAKGWFFPDTIIQALSRSNLPSPRFLLRCASLSEQSDHYHIPNKTDDGKLINTPALIINLSQGLVQTLYKDWYSKQTIRYLKVLAVYLDQPINEIRCLVQNSALEASRLWRLAGTQAPASGLLWPLQPPYKRQIKPSQLPLAIARLRYQSNTKNLDKNQPNSKSSATAISKNSNLNPAPSKPRKIGIPSHNLPDELDQDSILSAPKPPPPLTSKERLFRGFRSAEKRNRFESQLKTLMNEPDHFKSEHEALRWLVDTLYECSLLERIFVATHNKQENKLNGYYTAGCEDSPLLKKINIKLQPPNLFTQILKQPSALWVTPEKKLGSGGLIPGYFKQASQSDAFFIMSLFNFRGAYGALYADHGTNSTSSLSEVEYKIFKAACTTCNKHLITRAKRAAAKRSL